MFYLKENIRQTPGDRDSNVSVPVKQLLYLYSGEGLDDSDEVLLQQAVVQFGQVSVDNGVVPQLCSVLCERLRDAGEVKKKFSSVLASGSVTWEVGFTPSYPFKVC